MGKLVIDDVSSLQLVAMGDGLLAEGQNGMARQFYQIALKRAEPPERQQIRTRIGMATAATTRTYTLLKMLKMLEAEGYTAPFVSDGMATWLKTLPFADDQRFLAIADKHADLLPIANWHWNLQTALWAVQRCKDVPGDYVELGVFKGHTTLFCSEYVDFQDWPKTWFLYDTFDGIPEDQQAPDTRHAINDRTYKGRYSYDEVRNRFAGFPNIRVTKGRVPEILIDSAPSVIAFMRIDLNNAPAEIGALDLLFDRVSSGGIVLLDDYCWSTTVAQHDAEKAWCAKRGLQVLPMPTGQGILIKP